MLFFRFGGQGVQIGNDEETLVFVLKTDPVGDGAYVVPQMKAAGRPVAGKYSFFSGCFHREIQYHRTRKEFKFTATKIVEKSVNRSGMCFQQF